MNPYLQTILSSLETVRGIRATAVATEGTDGRVYVQVVGVPGFPVFTVSPSGKYDLPYEHSFTNAGMAKMGLPVLADKSEGLNAVLFADKLAERPRNRHDLCYGFDPHAINRVREMAAKSSPQESWKIWHETGQTALLSMATGTAQPSHTNHLKTTAAAASLCSKVSAPAVRTQYRSAMQLSKYFSSGDGQKRALEACRNFLGAKDWPVGARLKLYDASRQAFNSAVSPDHALTWFRQIYDDLVLPAPAGGWGIARNASGPLWSAEKTFQTVKVEFSGFAWGGPVALTNFHNGSAKAALLCSLEKMRSFKPVSNWPVMAVSKVLHFHNPELFPIYDNEVIWNKVLKHFRIEFREFCHASSPPYDVEDTPIFYRNYMCWGAYLLATAHPRFMEMFADWLGRQSGADLSKRQFDASRLFATAYEFTIIGAYADSGQ